MWTRLIISSKFMHEYFGAVFVNDFGRCYCYRCFVFILFSFCSANIISTVAGFLPLVWCQFCWWFKYHTRWCAFVIEGSNRIHGELSAFESLNHWMYWTVTHFYRFSFILCIHNKTNCKMCWVFLSRWGDIYSGKVTQRVQVTVKSKWISFRL